MFFKRITTLTRINDQIYDIEMSLIRNQGTADHYLALADGNRKTLMRLQAMKKAEDATPPPPNKMVKADLPELTPKTKLRAAT